MTNTTWTTNNLPSFTGRTVVITGANSGIGFVAAKELAQKGAHVVLAVRDITKGQEAAAQINGSTHVRELDLANLQSVHNFANQLSEKIDILINNAGVMVPPKGTTKDGFETQFGTNHLGHFALTNLLLPQISDRVVILASGAHRTGTMNFNDLNWEKRRYQRWAAYSQSKLANLLFELELQHRLAAVGSTVRAIAAHPGIASTNLQSHYGNPLGDFASKTLGSLLGQSAEDGALPTLYAVSEDIPSGSYVGPSKLLEMRGAPKLVGRTKKAKNREDASRLWTISEQLTSVSFPTL
ncbi:MAG: oxidoreductase [Mycobacteriaceae bacterium]